MGASAAITTEQVPDCLAPSLSRNLEEVCRFPELPARKPLTYQAKQLIAREIEMEKMRRAEALARNGDSPQVSPPLAWGRAGPRRADPALGMALPSQLSSHPLPAGGWQSPQGQGLTGGCWGERGTATHPTQPRAAAGAHPEESSPGGPGLGAGRGHGGGAVLPWYRLALSSEGPT